MPNQQVYTSPDRALTFVVEDLGDDDFAIGFRGYKWHTHADILSCVLGLPEDEAVRAYVDLLLADKSIIAIHYVDDVISDVWITEDPASEFECQQANESLQFRYWSGRKYEF